MGKENSHLGMTTITDADLCHQGTKNWPRAVYGDENSQDIVAVQMQLYTTTEKKVLQVLYCSG